MIGVLIGWLIGITRPLASASPWLIRNLTGLTQPLASASPWLTKNLDLAIPEPLLFAALVGLLWAILGAVIGFQLPSTWPILTGIRHWLPRSILWMIGLYVLTVGLCFVLSRSSAFVSADISLNRFAAIGLVGAAFALVPVAFRGVNVMRGPVTQATPRQSHFNRRNLMVSGISIVLFVLVFAGIGRQDRLTDLKEIAQLGAKAGIAGLDTHLQHWGDDLMLRYYDRRAPSLAGDEPTIETELMTITAGPGPIPPIGPTFPSKSGLSFAEEGTTR
jgi:hypothetical protein